jgi:hypothetical protein
VRHVCWKGKQTNFQEICDFIGKNTDNEKLKEFEAKLKEISLFDYNVYVYRYKERMTFAKIADKLSLDSTARVAESLNATSLSIQIFFDLVD